MDSQKSNKQIGERIRRQRISGGLSQARLAKEVGVTMQAISLWENGKALPGGNNLSSLAKILGCDVNWILEGEGVHCDEERIMNLLNARENNKNKHTEQQDEVENLHHLAQIFDKLSPKRQAAILLYAINQWKESVDEEIKRYEELYNKLK